MSRFTPAFFLGAVIWLMGCGPDAETWFQRAEKALKDEGSHTALPLYQRAFDLSLPETFYLTDADEVYSELDVSLDGRRAALVQVRADRKYSDYHILDTSTGEGFTSRVDGGIRFVALSPHGKFGVFIISASTEKETPVVEATCMLLAGELTEGKTPGFRDAVSCMEKPGISDQGRIYYMKDGKVMTATLPGDTAAREALDQTPDVPVSGVPAWGWFQFSLNEVPYFTYGAAGVYKLYRLNRESLALLDKTGAFGRIYFIPGEENPGIVTGGADTHRITFFHGANGKTVRSYPVHFWMDAAFFSQENYYYLENSRLYRAPGSLALDLWARKIYRAGENQLLILTPQGALIRYHGEVLPARTSEIFFKGWDL